MINRLFGIGSLLFATSTLIVMFEKDPINYFLLLIALLLYVSYNKNCKHSESIWLFVLLAIITFPMNITILTKTFDVSEIFSVGPVGKVLLITLLVAFLLSIEEIILGIIGRIIWADQRNDEV